MKIFLIYLSVLFFSSSVFAYGKCIAPVKPVKPIKPAWCSDQWVQQLQCDQYCNCRWVPVCINNSGGWGSDYGW